MESIGNAAANLEASIGVPKQTAGLPSGMESLNNPAYLEPSIESPQKKTSSLLSLPRELRNIIWQHIPPQKGSKGNLKSSMSILRTCKQVYAEVEPIIYKNEALWFRLKQSYDRHSWIQVSNTRGAVWHLGTNIDEYSQAWINLPYYKLTGIKIEIEAPYSEFDVTYNNLGPLICLWKKSDIGFSDIRVVPLYFVVLEPFWRVRNVEKAKVHYTEALLKSDRKELPLDFFEKAMMLKVPFGDFDTQWDYCPLEWEEWDDKYVKKDLDQRFLRFQRFLDGDPSWEANMLRLERFSTWYTDTLSGKSKYLDEMERAWKESRCRRVDLDDLHIRHRMMMALNPMSAAIKVLRLHDKKVQDTMSREDFLLRFENRLENQLTLTRRASSYAHKVLEDLAPHTAKIYKLKAKWDREEWFKYYPDGIPVLRHPNINLRLFTQEMGTAYSKNASDDLKRRFGEEWDRVMRVADIHFRLKACFRGRTMVC
ncbi:hypothetical protein G7Y89_g12069 [Cudoniella acicularis]|uniref:Uncharacterized protein n=1 Tax=Cudoniella acicularis TaxID=354080 RepID=A0A8H4RDA8_9HELO|nr:hypothetical protein G7Y89_g12069 [Cudoniella acicularis]